MLVFPRGVAGSSEFVMVVITSFLTFSEDGCPVGFAELVCVSMPSFEFTGVVNNGFFFLFFEVFFRVTRSILDHCK